MQTIYLQDSIANHPRTQHILARVGKHADIIRCQHYGEVFNRKAQNFRLQKQQPALILAEKTGRLVLPTPEGFGIGGQQNYYFSHMLNCLYDCRYCFLQGMYQSANYVLFVNYEDFMTEIVDVVATNNGPSYFFSGYDCDSLAFDPVSGFIDSFLPFFAAQPKAILELRTKSANIKALLAQPVITNCVVAFSFTPDVISRQVEHKVPSVNKRIQAMTELARRGWQVGIRLDPLIYADNYQELYQGLISAIFDGLPRDTIHSVSLGPLRLPKKMFQRLVKLYPQDRLLAQPFCARGASFSYQTEIEMQMDSFVRQALSPYLEKSLVFKCNAL